jgi:hypothetical protein
MAACGMCSELGKKLHKRWYNSYKVYVCMKCALDHENKLDVGALNGHYQDTHNCA